MSRATHHDTFTAKDGQLRLELRRETFTAKDGTELMIELRGEDADPDTWHQVGDCRVPAALEVMERLWDGGTETGDPLQEFLYVRYGFGMIGGAHRLLHIEMDSVSGTREIQAADLRRPRIEYVLEASLLHLCRTPWPAGSIARRRDVATVMKRRRRLSDDVLQEVARVYEANIDDAPTQAVANHFDLQLRTASLRVKRAREAGYITKPAKTGRKPQQ
ncbi:hypothetical protein [Arthrobacter celericrescens]|uniref:hypothetical protein n=1 Tax=Arthrobacter celericrescens TaxID=2320851 RepID=UPI0013C42D38|nr:hypothetical protein [Arthrobacter celericrescens]